MTRLLLASILLTLSINSAYAADIEYQKIQDELVSLQANYNELSNIKGVLIGENKLKEAIAVDLVMDYLYGLEGDIKALIPLVLVRDIMVENVDRKTIEDNISSNTMILKNHLTLIVKNQGIEGTLQTNTNNQHIIYVGEKINNDIKKMSHWLSKY